MSDAEERYVPEGYQVLVLIRFEEAKRLSEEGLHSLIDARAKHAAISLKNFIRWDRTGVPTVTRITE